MAQKKSNKPTQREVQKAQELLPTVQEALDKLDKKDKRIDPFCAWMKDNHGDITGYLRSSVANLSKDLKAIIDGESGSVSPEKTFSKAEKFPDFVNEYLSQESGTVFPGTEWLVYFFFLIKPERTPKLGRALLRFVGQKKVFLENTPAENSKDYSGTFTQVNQVISIDLRNSRNHQLHIKIECPDGADQEIALGGYITYESYRIVTGQLVLQKIDSKKAPQEREKPMLLSYGDKETREEFIKVPQAIRNYLCTKNMNYHSVPQGITTLNGLEKHIKRYNPFNGTKRRFFDPGPFKIFFAAPSVSYEDKEGDYKKIEELLGELRKTHGEENVIEKNSVMTADSKRSPDETLMLLRRINVLILYVAKKDVLSFAHLELGYAVAHCKHIIIIYNETKGDPTSRTIKSLSSIGVERIGYKDHSDNTINAKELQNRWEDAKIRLHDLLEEYSQESN